jgi:DNA sulfur modification protein DndE
MDEPVEPVEPREEPQDALTDAESGSLTAYPMTRRRLLGRAALGAAGLTLAGLASGGTGVAAPLAGRGGGPELGVGPLNPLLALLYGADAYVFGYPLVLMGVTKSIETNVPNTAANPSRAPVNQFVRGKFPDSTFTDVVLPSTSTLYCTSWLDLRAEPIVLHMPDIGDKFDVFQVLEAWTDVGGSDPCCLEGACTAGAFCSLGSRYGTQPGDYAFVGPDWTDPLPAGITRAIHLPTNVGWIIGRLFTSGTPEDLDLITMDLYPKITLTPLSYYGKPYNPPDQPVDPNVDMNTPPVDQVANMDAPTFFGKLADLMGYNPPHAADTQTLKRLAKIGIVPGQPFDWNQFNRATKATLQASIGVGKEIMNHAPPLSPTTTKWQMPLDLGVYGTQYLERALIAKEALGANFFADAIYGGVTVDSDNNTLTGANRYTVHFAADALPPANEKAFWSITLYNMPKENLFNGPIARNAVGWPEIQDNVLQFNADGSLDIFVQQNPPGAVGSIPYTNWIPAPPGAFQLFLRMYWPDLDALKNSGANNWIPPAVEVAM